MGGARSGRNRFRLLCEEALSIDVRRWKREGFLGAGQYFGWAWRGSDGEQKGSVGVRVGDREVTLVYTLAGEPKELVLDLSRARCHFGGERVWFLCPGCYKRRAKLYLRQGVFRCRTCQRLGYMVENQDTGQRLWMKAEKLERRLGPNLAKPKRMRERTYERLLARYYATHDRRDLLFDDELLRRFGKLLTQ